MILSKNDTNFITFSALHFVYHMLLYGSLYFRTRFCGIEPCFFKIIFSIIM